MEREAQRLGRFGGELSLVMLDIDNFKRSTTRTGTCRATRSCATLGQVLRLESRGVDEAARYGGEEFVLALPETPKAGAAEVAERVRERIETTQVDGVDGNAPMHVTASIGVATMPADGRRSARLIAAADAALYEAKRTGKNRGRGGERRAEVAADARSGATGARRRRGKPLHGEMAAAVSA